MKLFNKPPEQVSLSPESRKLFTDAPIFQHRPEIGRVIFIAAPLRGSELASNWLGRIGSSLVRSPITLLKAGRDVFKIMTFRSGELKLKRIPNSVDNLAPTNRFVIAINTIPITPGIPYHTILGDRGKGDAPGADGVHRENDQRHRFSKPTDTPARTRLAQMRSPVLEDGPFKELTFDTRAVAAFEVTVNLSRAVGLGKKVPKKILQGADESVEALKSSYLGFG
jgi:hypothetical protein